MKNRTILVKIILDVATNAEKNYWNHTNERFNDLFYLNLPTLTTLNHTSIPKPLHKSMKNPSS